MTNPQPQAPAPVWRFKPRVFLAREWPYLMVFILAIAGVAYTSFARTPITTYWVILAPLIGVICVVTRWPDAETRERRLHLIWTQALHWVAELPAARVVYKTTGAPREMRGEGSQTRRLCGRRLTG